MRTRYTIRRGLLVTLIYGGWLLNLPITSHGATVATVDRMNAVLTVTTVQVVNGVTEASGYLSAQATDSEGGSSDVVTNAPVTLPMVLGGTLAGRLAGISDYVPPPQLSTNLCTILAISIEFIDVTIPGLGLNVHVNQLLLAVRADRDTRLGDVLCTLLGEGAFNDTLSNVVSSTAGLNIRLDGTRVALDATGPATLQSTTTLTPPITWTDVLTVGPTLQTLLPTGPMQFFRLAVASSGSSGNSGSSPRGAFSLGRVDGVFTVSDFKSVNGSSMAAGWLSGNVTDSTGTSEVGRMTDLPVRVPVSGLLSGGPISAGFIDNPVILPQLSTNTCTLLGIVIGAIDITLPGLGLNLHVNEISIVARSDRETTIGDLLCTLLGDNNDLLGSPVTSTDPQIATSAEKNVAGTSKNALTVEQLRGLAGIVLGSGIRGTSDVSKSAAAGADPSANNSALVKNDVKRGHVQNLLQHVIKTIKPSKPSATGNQVP
jgi:hypothetical protein